MPRAKPFSTKAKKLQLQAKHARKREQAQGDSDSNHSEQSDGNDEMDSEPSRPMQLDSLGRSAGPAGMVDRRTFFRAESRAVLEERKQAAMKPFQRLPPSSLLLTAEALRVSETIELPHRPGWSANDTKAELDARETAAFEKWLKDVYAKYDESRLNYFEHNLEVWRQLWRTLELSDILLLLVDVRHPFFHFPVALYRMVVEEHRKPLVLVMNKTDLVPPEVVAEWMEFFRVRYPQIVNIVTFSSQFVCLSDADLREIGNSKASRNMLKKKTGAVGTESLMDVLSQIQVPGKSVDWQAAKDAVRTFQENKGKTTLQSAARSKTAATASTASVPAPGQFDWNAMSAEAEAELKSSAPVASASATFAEPGDDDGDESDDDEQDAQNELSSLIQSISVSSNALTIGLIGHPNVGKSSLINGMVARHVVSTSRTPGHTKYYQHIPITKEVRLMDCPGLVFPAVDVPKAVQVLMGLYPIAQVAEPFSAIQFIAERVAVEDFYKLKPDPDHLSSVSEDSDDDGNRKRRNKKGNSQSKKAAAIANYRWSSYELCEAMAVKKGLLASKGGRPDVHRAANFMLRDIVDGRLVLSFRPPPRHVWTDEPGAALSAVETPLENDDQGDESAGVLLKSKKAQKKAQQRARQHQVESDESNEEEMDSQNGRLARRQQHALDKRAVDHHENVEEVRMVMNVAGARHRNGKSAAAFDLLDDE